MVYMKKCYFFVLLAFALVCYVPQTFANDMAERLQTEVDEFKKAIESSRGAPLISAADLLTGTGLSDLSLYAIVEEKTKSLIAMHKSHPKDNAIAEEVAAMIRAMASMNTQSHNLIVDLVQSSSSRGLRNRAHRLAPKLNWFEKRNKIMQIPDSYQPGQDLMTHRYLNLLASGDYTLGRWALEEIERRGGAEPTVYEKMREILNRDKSSIQNDIHLDYLAWICKLLSRYDAAGSRELLSSIENDPSKNKQIRKLKKYINI
jgi:hypothetical protein